MFVANKSDHDVSVNWDAPVDVGRLEARYVRRQPDYVVVYLSSQTGCDQGCRMCHLTATNQVTLRDVTFDEFLDQADVVLDHYRDVGPPAQTVHFNFMARGEPLACRTLLADADGLLGALGERAKSLTLRPRFLLSTIMPSSLHDVALEDIFVTHHPEIYYSIYSVDASFRRRWLPKALPVEVALAHLASWQRHTNKICKLHYAFIEDENDSAKDVHAICDALAEHNLLAHINIVRYNPPGGRRRGTESTIETIERNAGIFRERLPTARVKIVGRVGYDVKASCGMFLGG